MEYKILVIKNKLPFDIGDQLRLSEKYFLDRTPIDISYDYMDSDMPVQLMAWNFTFKDGTQIYGTDGLRAWLEANKVDGTRYNAIIFLYDLAKTTWFYNQVGSVAHIAHWMPHQGATIIEVATLNAWGAQDVGRVITHELFHAYHQACRLNGVATTDSMDQYDDEFIIDSTTGNRARNIKELEDNWNTVVSQPYLMLVLSNLKLRVASLLLKLTPNMDTSKIEIMANAVKEHEGWYQGSRSYRNLNPANAKYVGQYTAIGKDKDGFAIFPTYEAGWNYLIKILTNACTGKSKVYSKEMTLLEFFSKYAPASDNNDSNRYAQVVADKLGVDIHYKIKNLIS